MGRTGTEIANSLIGKSGAEREALVWAALMADEVPGYLGDKGRWPQVVITDKDKDGNPHTLVMRVAPRPIEVGTEEDPFLQPMQPSTADRYANKRHAILSSRRLVDAIWNHSILRLPIGPPPGFTIPGPDMIDPRSWIAHNKIIQDQLGGSQALMSGGLKSVVVGPGLDGTHVAIYSTPFSGVGPLRPAIDPPGYQGYTTIHTVDHVDWSHGVQLIDRSATLDDKPVDLMDLFVDPVLYTLVSDQVPFSPEFPNVGKTTTYGLTDGLFEEYVKEGDSTTPIADPPSIYRSVPEGTGIGGGDVVIYSDQAQQQRTKSSAQLAGGITGAIIGTAAALLLAGLSAPVAALGLVVGAAVGATLGGRRAEAGA